jgi:hypothetical protein
MKNAREKTIQAEVYEDMYFCIATKDSVKMEAGKWFFL